MTNLIFKAEWLPLISTLPDEEAGKLIKAIAQHSMTGDEPDLSPIMTGIYQMMIMSIDENAQKYEERCKKSSTSAQARWEKKRAEQEQAKTEEPEQAEEQEKPKKQRKKKAAEPAPDPEPIPEVASMINFWNENIQPLTGKGAVCRPGTAKERKLQETIRAYSEAAIKKAFLKLKGSWLIKQDFFTFDWIMDPEHLEKVLQGNYDENSQKTLSTKTEQRRRPQVQLS